MTTSKAYEADQSDAPVDMSAQAVTARLRRVSQLRRLCLTLGKAQLPATHSDIEREADNIEPPEEPAN